MTDHEPYVREPAEPSPHRRLQSRRGTIGALAVAVLLAALGWLYVDTRSEQDPALEVPAGELTEPPGS